MNDPDNTITLSTGKSFYANHGIVGIDGEGNVYQGYDQGITFGEFGLAFDTDDKLAFAQLMIDRWMEFWQKTLLEKSDG